MMWPDLLVTTANGFYRCLNGVPELVRSESNFYGITWNEKSIFLVDRGDDPSRSQNSILVLDKTTLDCTGEIPTNARSTHQILLMGQELWVTDTPLDTIQIINFSGLVLCRWQLECPKDADSYGLEKNHINSLWWDGEHVWLVANRVCQVHQLLPSKPPTIVNTSKICPHAHNVVVRDGVLFMCAGKAGAIWYRDLESLEEGSFSICPGGSYFLRGLAVTENQAVCGVSDWVPRDERKKGDGKLLLLDKEFSVVDETLLRNSGDVYEVRVTSEPDLAHYVES